MHRTEANTVSTTHIVVGSDQIALSYAPGSPCVTAFDEGHRLELRPRPARAPEER